MVHDELDFAPGTAKMKQGGGIAGHNGLHDISQRLGSHDYWRLRLGIGHPGDKNAVADYVLQKPSAEDRADIDEAIGRSIEILPLCLSGRHAGRDAEAAQRGKSEEGKAGREESRSPRPKRSLSAKAEPKPEPQGRTEA